MKIPVSSFLSYLWSYLAYRDVLYIKLKLLRFCFDLMLSFLAPGSIFVEQLRQEVVSFVFRVAQTVFVPNFYIPLIWQLFFFFLWIFSSYAKELMHMISRKKKLCIWYHFIEQNFQIHFVNVFFTHPLSCKPKDLYFSNNWTVQQANLKRFLSFEYIISFMVDFTSRKKRPFNNFFNFEAFEFY